jgi:hypothetical protein
MSLAAVIVRRLGSYARQLSDVGAHAICDEKAHFCEYSCEVAGAYFGFMLPYNAHSGL